MFHWSPRCIEAHVKLCVLALQMQRAAEIRCTLPWARIAQELATLKAVRYGAAGRTIVQRTKITDGLGAMLKKLGVSTPKQIMSVSEQADSPVETSTHALNPPHVTLGKHGTFQRVCPETANTDPRYPRSGH
jgi:hypothetical protein